MTRMGLAVALAGLWLLAGSGVLRAADGADTIMVAKSAKYGRYIVDEKGLPLYVFSNDTAATSGHDAKITCTSLCLKHWPPLTTGGTPETGELLDPTRLGTVMHTGKAVVTYNGWPLYRFVDDHPDSEPKGEGMHSFGGTWYLITPKGEKIELQ